MKCPICQNEMEKGSVEAKNANSFTNTFTTLVYFPDEQEHKKIFRRGKALRIKGQGYYCDVCMKVFAMFDES